MVTAFENWQLESLLEANGNRARVWWSRFSGDIFRIPCGDTFTVNFFKEKVLENRKLLEGITLSCVDKDKLLQRPRISIWLPGEYRSGEEILRIMSLLNEGIDLEIDKWRVIVREVKEEKGQWLLLGIPVNALTVLSKQEGAVWYLNRKVRFTLPDSGKVLEKPDILATPSVKKVSNEIENLNLNVKEKSVIRTSQKTSAPSIAGLPIDHEVDGWELDSLSGGSVTDGLLEDTDNECSGESDTTMITVPNDTIGSLSETMIEKMEQDAKSSTLKD